jgi:hypothetical protein
MRNAITHMQTGQMKKVKHAWLNWIHECKLNEKKGELDKKVKDKNNLNQLANHVNNLFNDQKS